MGGDVELAFPDSLERFLEYGFTQVHPRRPKLIQYGSGRWDDAAFAREQHEAERPSKGDLQRRGALPPQQVVDNRSGLPWTGR